MNRSSTFWTAFLTGLAAPALLYGPLPTYRAAALPAGIGRSFAAVGASLSQAFVAVRGEPERSAANAGGATGRVDAEAG
jgi:hypothetical protein